LERAWWRASWRGCGDSHSCSAVYPICNQTAVTLQSPSDAWAAGNYTLALTVDGTPGQCTIDVPDPLVLRNVGACDLVSVRGIMHAVQCSRLADFQGSLILCDWQAAGANASRLFAGTRAEHLARACARMQATVDRDATATVVTSSSKGGSLESRYLSRVVDPTGSLEYRLAAGLLGIRACFFSTNYEGAMLAAEVGLDLLRAAGGRLDEAALLSAWDALDDPSFDIPMLELDRSSLGDAEHVRGLLLLHIGISHVFSGHPREGLDLFGQALECRISPEFVSDLRLYRALIETKTLRNIGGARAEIAAGLSCPAMTKGFHGHLSEPRCLGSSRVNNATVGPFGHEGLARVRSRTTRGAARAKLPEEACR
jgi:hypothetical protein